MYPIAFVKIGLALPRLKLARAYSVCIPLQARTLRCLGLLATGAQRSIKQYSLRLVLLILVFS